MFRQFVERAGLLEDWYAFEHRAYKQIMADWLDTHDIPYTRGDAHSEQ